MKSRDSKTRISDTENSYNFENDELSILTDSRTHSPEHSGSFHILPLPEASEDHQQYSKKNYHFYVDKLGDPNLVGKKVQSKTKPKKTTY
eukprot:UN06612